MSKMELLAKIELLNKYEAMMEELSFLIFNSPFRDVNLRMTMVSTIPPS